MSFELGSGAEARWTNIGARRAVVEFVSANPTGPLHVGHGRQAALGDAIASLLDETSVTGDSIVFAVQVAQSQTFCEQLERRLNARGDGRRYRVINAGVQGYGPAEIVRFANSEAPSTTTARTVNTPTTTARATAARTHPARVRRSTAGNLEGGSIRCIIRPALK